MTDNSLYTLETAKDLMVTNVLTGLADDTVSATMQRLAKKSLDDIHAIYVVDEANHLLGLVMTTRLLISKPKQLLKELMVINPLTVKASAKRDSLVAEIIHKDAPILTVVDDDNCLLGVISDDQVINILHAEHMEDYLRSSGFNEVHHGLSDLIQMNWLRLVRARLPWLLFGLMVGLIGSLITSSFEVSFRQHITLAFFLPVMTYMSDAIGTQTEAIFIRAVTLFKIKLTQYIVREALIGMTIGVFLGVIAGFAGYVISGSTSIGLVVMISMFLSMTTATVLACLTPIVLTMIHKDEAVGSGPFTTALQDLLSITIYLITASILLN
ncbi:magnesium transporter [candidate division WWE3 bacterium]|nr:magnesium transporter [candidate division WWE3 bacterium]